MADAIPQQERSWLRRSGSARYQAKSAVVLARLEDHDVIVIDEGAELTAAACTLAHP
jgi:hypothetical protein